MEKNSTLRSPRTLLALLVAVAIVVAALLYLLLRHLEVHPVIAAAGLVPLLLDGYIVNIEHYVLTEAFFNLLVVASLVLLAWSPKTPSPAAVMASGILLGSTGLLRFPGVALIVPALGYCLLRRFGWLRIAAVLAGFTAPLLVYGLWFESQTGTLGLTDRNGLFLYGRVVQFADCSKVEVPADEREFCPDPRRPQPPVKGVFKSGLNIDKVMKEPDGNARLVDFSRRMIRGLPLAYARAAWSDFTHYFEFSAPQSREPNVAHWQFVTSIRQADPRPAVVRLHAVPPPSYGLDRKLVIDRDLAGYLRGYQALAYTYGPLLALLLLLGLIGGVLGWRTRLQESSER